MLAVPEALKDEAVSHLQNLLRIDTTNPPGNETAAATYMKKVLEDAGIPATVHEPVPGRGSVVARLKATAPTLGGIAPGDAGGPLLMISHLDVVPAERAQWSHDPFSGEIAGGCVWGRGAVDMKSLAALSLTCVLHLKRRGVALRRDVVLAGVADEEAGSDKGSRWLVAHEPDALRAEWALCEVGGFTLHVEGKRVYPIQVAERGVAWLRLTAEGKPGHGSLPHADNAVLRLARAVGRLHPRALPVHVSAPARAFLHGLGDRVGGTWGRLFRRLATPWLTDFLLRHIPEARARTLNATLRNTVSPTVLEAGSKENVIPSRASAVLDGRIVPGFTTGDLIEEVKAALGQDQDGIRIEVLREAPPHVVDSSTPLFDLLARTITEHDPGAVALPYMISGFTDAQPLSALRVKTYGFNPVRLPEGLDFASLYHAHDERIPLDGFRWGVSVLCSAVEAFCVA
ncbi:M20/M25/M40 family metallo-hydrolase [bacterium]|nr:M20/M25/M40 family metallo-hydrolase [bacterium]